MKTLSIECSATPCSVAITDNDKVLASSFINVKLTHSQTLIPMVEALLKSANVKLSEIEGFAVSAGPGSFTGIRIGISAIKGLAQAKKIPCASVSTLEAIAYNFIDTDCIVCAVMDARCNQVYNALFKVKNGEIERLCPDRALMCDELSNELSNLLNEENLKVFIAGDGTDVFYPFAENIKNVIKSFESRRYQSAIGVSLASIKDFDKGNTISPEKLLPIYLRLPQAERELKQKKELKK
ncbi:MAG: tRNA (adenosine(37)-N6)-threonylcarbamoyltransferase complex dimerization subunit type 1 TsaB [Clostridia bacterium]|nr:tRNA (adenosine(37)-N6)-threonylcarbamoyltransferase complex dimerization subunit type 1 TsaB [Clostridia bacterium]